MNPKPPTSDLPETLRKLFWDYDFDRLSWELDRELITSRVLISGPWQTIRWLRTRLGDEGIARWIVDRQGRGLSPQQLRFWELILGLPSCQVDAWLAERASDPWWNRLSPSP